MNMKYNQNRKMNQVMMTMNNPNIIHLNNPIKSKRNQNKGHNMIITQ